MTAKLQNEETVWGVEFGGSAVRLVRVSRSGSAYRAERYLESPLPERWTTVPNAAAAAARLGAKQIEEPLAACVADELVLFRTLSLPDADEGTLAKMVAGQLEVLIPTQAERLVTAYRTGVDPYKGGFKRILACAARRDALAGPIEACRLLGAAAKKGSGLRARPSKAPVIVPSILALAATWTRLCGRAEQDFAERDSSGSGPEPVLLLDVGARYSGLAVVAGGQVADCGVIGLGGDSWTERIAKDLELPCHEAEQRKLQYASDPSARQTDTAVARSIELAFGDWSRQLREAYQDCTKTIPRDGRPGHCVLFGRAARMPGLDEIAAKTLGMDVRAATAGGLKLAGGMEFDCVAAAAGAAVCLLEDDAPAVSLTGPVREKQRGGPKALWRWAALVGWLLAAVFVRYGLDRADAGRQRKAVRETRAKVARRGGLARQLAVGKYLEASGPTPLDVLDRLSDALPEKAMLSRLVYIREGDRSVGVSIGGTVPSKEYLTILRKLGEIGQVELKTGRTEKKNFRFDIRLSFDRLADRPAAAPPATKPAKAPTSKAASRPASKPTTGPTSGRSGPTTRPTTRPTSSPASMPATKNAAGPGGAS